MKFIIEERTKYRLIGVIVLLSIAAVFIPAITKQSSQRYEENVSLSVRLPEKPLLPSVAVTEEKALFKTIKVAKKTPLPVEEAPQLSTHVKAEPLGGKPVALALKEPVLNEAVSVIVPVRRIAEMANPSSAQSNLTLDKKASLSKKGTYAVQLASFSQQSNAQSLVTRLRSKGYKATYNQSKGKQGPIYKVIVGELSKKDEAQILKKQLAEITQLTGFIIKTRIS